MDARFLNMTDVSTYSARTVFDGMKKRFHQYLEAQYHIWDEGLITDRINMLESEGVTFKEPMLEATPFYMPGKSYAEIDIPEAAKLILTASSKEPATGIPKTPYQHQVEAIEQFVGLEQEIIVATGTGSGKTESFLMPILASLAIEAIDRPQSWLNSGCRALLLYPMNALVNDQVTRLRRLLGNPVVANRLKGTRNHNATFGMYTSRTPYPGKESHQKNEQRLESFIQKAFLELPENAQEKLLNEGKWPIKDLHKFISSDYSTSASDIEMISRQEMQTRCPDVLVTNYSMLEYMLLRPIEAEIFNQTSEWLASDPRNKFTIVLDEAHMYRGAAGAEVALLLRRLQARLRIPRNRIKFILTSASLGSTDEAHALMKKFAADLSGLRAPLKEFKLITGKQQTKPGARVATFQEGAALADYDFTTLHTAPGFNIAAQKSFLALCDTLNHKAPQVFSDKPSFQHSVFDWIQSFGPAAFVANKITSKPRGLRDIATLTFPQMEFAEKALEGLLALMSFAKEKESGKVFSPIRSHIFFRGLSGIYACIDPECSFRSKTKIGILGNLYSSPRLTCECGCRVYEVLTHRDCGTAFIRGYMRDSEGDFLWHQPSNGLWGASGLFETHLLVELNRPKSDINARHQGSSNWLHKTTGRLINKRPEQHSFKDYIEVLRPDRPVQVSGKNMLTFENRCPVCMKKWLSGTTKIMDLATKGEAPFAQLIRTQVELQPPTIVASPQSPNGGRKSLLFSDGRQKAARLARDIPREIENDVFRQLLLLAVKNLCAINQEARLRHIYVAVIHSLANNSILLFDGNDRHRLQLDIKDYIAYYGNDLKTAIDESYSPPSSFNALLLRNLGSPFYSVSALTLAHIYVTKLAYRNISNAVKDINKNDLDRILIVWLQSFASAFAIDSELPKGVRMSAAGHPVHGGLDITAGFSQVIQDFLKKRYANLDDIFKAFSVAICRTISGSDDLFLDPSKLTVVLANEEQNWYQCACCTTVSPVEWWGHCPTCLASGVSPVNPGKTDYLRARKAFFRDPVIEVLEGKREPFNLSVEEHTAQLSYRDVDDPSTTTEDFERRFRDILVTEADTSIDVLSSTTTMEVGIDIGSLVAVGLRNIPPMRQNYQQRAGRTGRRGSAISTVVTYAQNSPHDNHYFENPEPIICGEPSLPGIDIKNSKIIERHIRAQLIQSFFHSGSQIPVGSDIYSVLGKTMSFFYESTEFSLNAFKQWLMESTAAQSSFSSIKEWLPESFKNSPALVANEFIDQLNKMRPNDENELEASELNLIEFLFARGFLPSYAFPRDICALQIEGPPNKSKGYAQLNILQRPQQGLNVALSEYAPGRFVVVDKKTYRIGTVAANGAASVENKAEKLFSDRRFYLSCTKCGYTPGFRKTELGNKTCPLCMEGTIEGVSVIVPQVVYPDGRGPVDEYDDDQLFTNVTSAQLSISEDESNSFQDFGVKGQISFSRDQQLVMVNKGDDSNGKFEGFSVCNLCGKVVSDNNVNAHARDYYIAGRQGASLCHGDFEKVYLGYGFNSDVLLLRIPIVESLRFDPLDKSMKSPISDALQSLAEALVLGISRQFDIDIREINAGYRYIPLSNKNFADIFIYDTLSGGAGYATLAGGKISEVICEAEKLLVNCDCSASCDKCLRHYGNRFHHINLDRFLALDLLRFIRDGELPSAPSIENQRENLKPLIDMMKLAGWVVQYSDDYPARASKNQKEEITLYSCPSLVKPEHYGFLKKSNKFVFSSYELSRDLPGAYESII